MYLYKIKNGTKNHIIPKEHPKFNEEVPQLSFVRSLCGVRIWSDDTEVFEIYPLTDSAVDNICKNCLRELHKNYVSGEALISRNPATSTTTSPVEEPLGRKKENMMGYLTRTELNDECARLLAQIGEQNLRHNERISKLESELAEMEAQRDCHKGKESALRHDFEMIQKQKAEVQKERDSLLKLMFRLGETL